MIIYKITNQINNKSYIGQTLYSLEERWHRHIQDAMSNRLDTHFARAIRKYGEENFIATIIDDTATTQEELTKLESYYIKKYNTVINGYNETDAETKCGGNTYKYKTNEEMEIIKDKIRKTKMGGNNPNARKIKILNVETGEELHFGSAAEVRDYFHHGNHNFVIKRCRREIKCLWQKKWKIAYEENDYDDFTKERNNARSKRIKVTNLKTNEEKEFLSYAEAERYFNLNNKALSGKAYQHDQTKPFIVKEIFKIEILM